MLLFLSYVILEADMSINFLFWGKKYTFNLKCFIAIVFINRN